MISRPLREDTRHAAAVVVGVPQLSISKINEIILGEKKKGGVYADFEPKHCGVRRISAKTDEARPGVRGRVRLKAQAAAKVGRVATGYFSSFPCMEMHEDAKRVTLLFAFSAVLIYLDLR